MCNLYQTAKSADLIAQAFPANLRDLAGNEPWSEDVYPDRLAPIIRNDGDGLVIAKARWGMPTPPTYLKTARDPGVTNVRNTASPHWQRWLGAGHRCLVPMVRFCEPGADHTPVWLALRDERPMFFAGIQTQGWVSVRKVKDGETTDDLFAILTCPPNAEVAAIHPKAMPVILTEPDEWKAWLSLEWDQARLLQRPLRDGSLRMV
ncbi:SOS response-associated peptidase family protein [Paracoccus sp. (in: a-proteobacteria)]|uniref:SOS response-associated peptidase n=1 Tax=Paracoccus sp. TaxID=267 RepID=UPI00289A6028|nr:SOS response-associated peptidase family protein [Paracoccus sp. (in: a-proteobacteria)]